MQITPRHPLMRNSEIAGPSGSQAQSAPKVVQISAWAVRAADLRDEDRWPFRADGPGQERYPARWSGWTLKQPTRGESKRAPMPTATH